MVQIEVRLRKILIDDPQWPVEIVYDAHWLDSGVYMYRDSITRWLTEHSMDFVQHQFGKRLSWSLRSEEDATLFLLRWGK